MPDKPAVLGGTPAFERTFPIVRPSSNEFAGSQTLDQVAEVLQSRMLSNVGIYVREFEERLERRLGVDHVVAVSSCTVGLILTLHALGIRNQRVALPSFTFSATGLACYWTGNRMKYVDIDDTLTLNPSLLKDLEGIVEVLLPVHMYGNPCAVNTIRDWAERTEVPVVYDAAHALGSSWHGIPVGGFGTAEVFSLSPTKLITTGEGGFVATNDETLASSLRLLRNYGNSPDYACAVPGLNARMSELNAVLGLEMLRKLDEYVANRNRYVRRYRDQLGSVPGISLQAIRSNAVSGHKDFSVFVDPEKFGMDRNLLAKALRAENIATKTYFYPPLHELEAFSVQDDVSLPITDRASRRVLSLPIHNVMRDADIDQICRRIILIHHHARPVMDILAHRSC